VKELSLVALDTTLTITAYCMVGKVGATYLILASWFSMGFLCHPLVGFWILQHLCVSEVEGGQPTVSYNGSRIWNILCLNELLHVEHHDFAGVCWRQAPRLRELAPDFYDCLYRESSIFGLILAWARNDYGPNGKKGASGKKPLSWDFGCRTQWGYGRNPPPRAVTSAHRVAENRRSASPAPTKTRRVRCKPSGDSPTVSTTSL